MSRLIIIRGYPGSGKTTIGKILSSENIGVFVDHNAILTFIASIAGNDDGIYEDIAKLELAITRKLLKDEQTVIVARGFSDRTSMDAYIRCAEDLNLHYDIFRLDVDVDILAKRVQSEERLNDFNPTISHEALAEWIKNNPLENVDGEVRINNVQPLAAVTDIILNTLKVTNV